MWLWSLEFEFARHWLRPIKKQGSAAWDTAKEKPVHTTVVTVLGLVGAAFLIWAALRYDLLDRGRQFDSSTTQSMLVGTRRVRTELAGINIGEVVTDRTAPDRSLYFQNRFCKFCCVGLIHFQNKKCETLGRFRPDAGKLLELFDKPADGFCDVHFSEQTGNLEPACEASELILHDVVHFTDAFVDCGDNQILQHVFVAAVENFRFDLYRKQLFLPVHFDGDHAAPCRCINDGGFHLFLQLLLHLLSLLHHLLQIHDYSPFDGFTCARSPLKTRKNCWTKGSSLALSAAGPAFC